MIEYVTPVLDSLSRVVLNEGNVPAGVGQTKQ